MEHIRPFEYRPLRTETGLAVDFECAGRTNQGVCWNLASTGIRAEFVSPSHLGEIGKLTPYHAERVFQVSAEVAYVNGRQAGLIFRFLNDEEREEAAEIARSCKPLEPRTSS